MFWNLTSSARTPSLPFVLQFKYNGSLDINLALNTVSQPGPCQPAVATQTTRDGITATIAFTHTQFQINQIYQLKIKTYQPAVLSPLRTQR